MLPSKCFPESTPRSELAMSMKMASWIWWRQATWSGQASLWSVGSRGTAMERFRRPSSSAPESVVSWLAGNGDGTFQAPIVISTSADTDTAILVQNFSGDGHPDIVLGNQGSE